MATTTELRASPHAQWELVLLIDGIARAFASHPDLEVLDSGDGREYVRGLVRDGLVRRIAIDDRSGEIIRRGMRFELEDHRGDLPSLFKTDDDSVEDLEQIIEPGDDLSALTDFHDKHIGTEKIGPNGERHQYPVPLGWDVGMHHHVSFDDGVLPLHPPTVSDVPVLWRGRRCMLYRVFRDHIGNPALEQGLAFRPDLQTLLDGPSGVQGTADGTGYRGGPRRAREFNGTTDRLDWLTMPDLVGQPFTLSFWIYRYTEDSDDRPWNTDITSNTGSVFVDVRTNGSVRILWAHNGVGAVSMQRQSAAGVIPVGRWTHVVVVGDGSSTAANYRIYVDREEVPSYATTINGVGTARTTTFRWSIGGRAWADAANVDGRIADMRVWLRELSEDEIEEVGLTVGGWRPYTEWERVWWGVLDDQGSVKGRIWTLECSGPESWLQKDLGTTFQTQGQPLDIDITYEPHEAFISIRITKTGETTVGTDYGHDDFSTQFTATNLADLRLELRSALVAASTATGADGVWSSLPGCVLQSSASDATITFSKGADVAEKAVVEIGMHKRLWGLLGWDLGKLLPPGPPHWNNFQDYELKPFTSWPTKGSYSEPPSDGYVLLPIRLETFDAAGNPDASQALTVEVAPTYRKGGVVSLDPDVIATRGQVAHVELPGTTVVAHPGQLALPPASDPSDVSEPWPIGGPGVDRCGLWMLTGQIRYADTEEEIEETQFVRASWRDSGGLVSGSEIVMTHLYKPETFGVDRKRLSKAWNAAPRTIQARPLIYLGYKHGDHKDDAHLVMQRILLSTGTSTGWWADPPTNTDPGYDGETPVLDIGENEPQHPGVVRRDAEVADLGLAIPSEMVQINAWWNDEAEDAGEAIKCKVAIAPGANAEQVLQDLMTPIGWAWSLRGNRYGIFTPFAPIGEDQIEVAITRATIDRGEAAEMVEPEQVLREYAPIDRYKVQYSYAPYLDSYLFERTHESIDRGRRYRTGGIEEAVNAPFYRSKDTTRIESRLMAKGAFWERRHFTIKRLPVLPTVGRLLHVGTFVRFSHDLAVDPILGEYGVAGCRGVVTAIEESMDRDRAVFLVDFLIHADRTSTPKLHAFSARGYGWDSANTRIRTHDNWLGLVGDGTRVDSAFFVEPSYVGVEPFGGSARVKWMQWDGAGWEETGSGVVGAISTTPGSCYIELSSMSGTYYACKDTIVLPADISTQDAAWVLQLYTPIGDETGEYSTGQKSARWEDIA